MEERIFQILIKLILMERTIRQLLFTVRISAAVLDIQTFHFTSTSKGQFI